MRVFEFDRSQGALETLELDRNLVDDEAQLETWLHANPKVILNEPLLIFGRQWGLDSGVPDLLALDQWGNTVVIELKKGKSGTGSASEETILSQPWVYASDLRDFDYEGLEKIYTAYKSGLRDGKWGVGDTAIIAESLIDAHETVFGGQIDRSEFNGYQRMVILAEDITSETAKHVRGLIDKGLEMQCVEVQWFGFPEGAPVSGDISLLVSSVVVDYPISKVRPDRSSVDFSDLTEAIRNQAAARVRDREGIADIRATPTQVKIESDYPPKLRYEAFVPRKEAGREAEIRVNAEDVADEDIEQIRAVLTDQLGDETPYEVDDNGVMAIVSQPKSILIGEQDIEGVEEAVAELVFLINSFQSPLVQEFSEVDE